MSRMVNAEWDAFSNSINIDRSYQAFAVFILVVI